MALQGKAALAMWWEVQAPTLSEFEDWHSHEHFAERMAIPGFRRGTRWRSATGTQGIFQMYELADYAMLHSADYLARLNAPTLWSTRMMPEHRDMVRSQCHVLQSFGGGVAAFCLTVRLTPATGQEAALQAALRDPLATLPRRPGIVGAHLLRHQSPPIPQTAEQKIRGGDAVADWVLVVHGYEAGALQVLAQTGLATAALVSMGARPETLCGLYGLSHSATPGDAQDLR